MSTEFIKIERTITKRTYGLDWKDKLTQISGSELNGYDLSQEFKDSLWDDMSIDIDELIEEFGEKEDITKLVNTDNTTNIMFKREDVIKRLNDAGIYEGKTEQYINVTETEEEFIIIIDGTFKIKKDRKGM